MENKQINTLANDELSLKEIILIIKDWWKYLLSKWIFILVFGLSGAALGVVYSVFKAPKYTAHLSFALIESGGEFSGLADLATSFGVSGLLNGKSGAFSGDNLLEIIVSRRAVEQTLLVPVDYKGQEKTLIDVFIEFNQLKKKWKNNKKVPELKNISFPVGQPRETFTRLQDSVLNLVYKAVSSPKVMSVVRKNKKISIVTVDFTSTNEVFSKIFVENLMDQTYTFYSSTRTSQSRANIEMMQHTADSIKNLYETALYNSAGISRLNVNQALTYASVPRIKHENNAQLYGAVYAEVLKNLETLKLDLARKTPLVQIIDTPRYPLYKTRFGKLKGLIFGGVIGGIIAVGYLLSKLYLKNVLK